MKHLHHFVWLQERWQGLLAETAEEDLQDLPEATDVRMKAEEFQNYAQQMENAVLSLAISVEEVRFKLRVYSNYHATLRAKFEILLSIYDSLQV